MVGTSTGKFRNIASSERSRPKNAPQYSPIVVVCTPAVIVFCEDLVPRVEVTA